MDTVDIDTIDDEDVLKQMWQVTEDFAEKRRIRARMYKLREKRLKDFYTSDDVMTAGSPSAASLPSQSATSSSYNFSTTSAATTTTSITSSSAMETDETDGLNSQQKRRNDANQEEDAVSEKIRRKSSVRTKRYQMVLAASGDADASSESTTKMETSSEQRAMTPDSLSGSQQLIMAADEQIQKSLSIRPEELSISVLSDSSYQELKSSSHRREFQEGDILTIQEVTETWRRIRESGQSNPVTQRVTLTKTIRQRVSDGTVLEENEDEVIDDIDDDTQGSGSGGITAVDAALRRSSIIAITTTNDVGVEESATVAKKKFETGVIDDNVSEADSLDNNLPEPDNVDTHSLADSLELNQTTSTTSTFTSMTTQQHQSTNQDSFIRMDSDVSNQSVGNLEEQVEELIVPESKPATVTTSSATRTKRTPSESPSRGGATAPAKKRADSAELRRQTTAASNTTSRTGLGGINRNAYSSSNTSSGANKSSAKSPSSPSASLIKCSIPRLTSTPISAQKGKKPAVADSPAADDSVTEFLQLEKEIQSEKVEDVSKTTGMKRPVTSSNRPTTPVSSRKAAESVSTRSTSSSRVTSVSSSTPDNKKGMAAKTTTSVNRSSTSTTSTGRKELASPSSTKPGSSIGRPTMIRTVETTRTITVRDRDEDKPWRVNSSTSSSNRSKGISGIGRPARKDLHNNVMSVVEKYVDTEGCALHGSHPHIHDDDDGHHHHDGHSPSPPAPEGQKPAADEEEEEPVVAPPAQTNGVEADEPEDLSSAAPQEEETPVAEVVAESREENPIQRPKKLSVTMHPPMEGAIECATSPLNKSGSRLSIASPVLGSPSVVKKARSLFHSDSFDGSEAPKAPEPVAAAQTATGGTASISKIRSSFESSSTSNTSTIKRENTKLWEPANRINKLDRPSLVKDVSDSSSTKSAPVARPNSNNSGLFSKSRSPSPAKEIATPTASVRQPTQPESTPVPSAIVTPADDTPALPSGANQVIEDIEDLTLLENMLNTATNYDDRSRIRAHIRTVKKKLGLAISSPMPQRKAAPAPAAAVTTPKPSEPAVNRNKLPDFKKKEPSPVPVAPVEAKKEPVVAPIEEPIAKTLPEPVKVERLLEDVEMSSSVSTLSSSTTMVTEETMTSETSVSRKTSLTQQQTKNVRKISQPYDCRSETKEFVPRVAEEQPTVTVADGDQVNGDVTSPAAATSSDQEGSSETSSPKMSRAPWRRQSSEANMMVKTPTHLPEPESNPETLDITSSYGTGPMDENGRPLFGLGALRRRPTKPLNLPGAPEEGQAPQPIIIERSQTLTELQKLHEWQTIQQQPKGELEPVEKPRAKLRDTFTNSMDTESDGDRAEPIISERSQALREIIRIHEQQVSSAEATAVEAPPPSPTRPKAKLKDSFVAPIDSPDEPDQPSMEQTIESRSESFQTIIKRHQELSTSQAPTGPLASPPMKRPGILKKPKDWSSPSPQEVPSPVKDDDHDQLTSSRKTSQVELMTMETTRKASIESSIEIQLNPVQSSSIVVTEIPASGLMDRRSSGVATPYSTIQYNSVQDVKMDTRRGSQHQHPRKFSVEVEPSPVQTHTSSVTLPTNPSAVPARTPVPTVAPAPFVLSGETTGHSIRSTSTFQLQSHSSSSVAGRNTSTVVAPTALAPGRNTSTVVAPPVAPVPTGDDPTPWRRKSIPREPSLPRDVEVTTTPAVVAAPPTVSSASIIPKMAEIPPAQPQQPVQSRVSMAKLSMNQEAPPTPLPVQTSNYSSASPLPLRSNRMSSTSAVTTTTSESTSTSPFQRTGSINNRYRPSQPENNAPFGSGGEPRVKTLPATGASVRALAQKFLVSGDEKNQPQASKSSAYPKAGLIFRSNSFRSQNNGDGSGSIGLVRSESLRISPARCRVSMDRQSQERSMDENGLSSRRESHTFESSSERRTSYNQTSTATINNEPSAVAAPVETGSNFTTTTSKSFLQDRTPVRGMQDIIGRMRAGDAGSGAAGSEDEHSLSLLNKLIGAQILVQCTEQAASSAGLIPLGAAGDKSVLVSSQQQQPEGSVQSFSSCTEERSADGTRLSRTATQQRTGSSFESGQDEDSGTSWTRRSSSTAKFQTTRTSSTVQHPTANQLAIDDHIGNGVGIVGGIGIGTGMAQTSSSSSIPGTAAGRAATTAGCVIDGIDISTCTDDFKLNEMLDNCNDYETRRQLRARIKTLLSDVKVNDGDNLLPSCSQSSSSSVSSSSSSGTANSPNVTLVNPVANSDVMDWVRRQAQTLHSTTNDSNNQQQQQVEAPPLPNDLPAHPAALQSQESGELFDSGTESGEDSTTQSNHSQSDLNSFMANLAKLSLEQHQPQQQQQQQQPSLPSTAPPEETIPAARDFLRQVDSVLDRLKTSLQPDDLAEFNAGPSADHQEVLHQHLASGGLDKQWRIHPQQQSELIGLIDRLKTSLNHLQATDSQPVAPVPDPPVPATPPVPASTPVRTVATPVQSSPAKQSPIRTKPVESPKVEGKTGKATATITVASPPGSVNSLTGITCVKLRAKTFTTAQVERPVSRPNSFLLNVSSSDPAERQTNRLSWRSSSEPNTPVTSPSPTPTPSPLPPPKIHWRSPKDFLATTTTTTASAAVCRPVWCRDTSSNNNNNSSCAAPGKIKLLEKSGIRGRFVQPELNPAPVVTPKIPALAVRLPSFSLNKVQPASPPSHQNSRPQTPQTPQTPPAQVTALTLQQPARPLQKQKQPERPVQKQQQTQQHERPVVQLKQPERPVDKQQKQKPVERPVERPVEKQKQPEKIVEKQPEEIKNSDSSSSLSSSRNKSNNNSNVPWKVKLAKKKAERSQTTTGMDGQVSVDLRKSIRLAAATRKSMEDIRAEADAAGSPPASFKLKTSEPSAYPLLKQKSLGELYAPRLPKPFMRSESVGAAGSSAFNTPDIKSSSLRKFNWNSSSRSSSVDRIGSIDLSSAPQTPLSPDPPSPVVMAAGLMPSKSGHSWVLSMKAAPPAAPESPKVQQPVQAEEKQVEKMVQQVKAEEKLVPKEPEESEEEEDEEEEVVTVGVLNLGAKEAEQVKAPEPSASFVPLEERQTSLKTDPSAVLFTPAETLQIAIHKAAIKASLSRQMSERNIGDPSSPSLAPESPGANKKTHPLDGAIKPEKASPLVEAVQKHPPQLIRAKTSPKLTPPASAFNFKSAPVASPPPVATLPEASQKAADPPVAPVESSDKSSSVPSVEPAEAQTIPPLLNPAIQKELQKAEQYIKAAMAPIPSWKERARRSNTVAFSSGPGSSWRPVQAPSQMTIKTENDRKFQNLFQKNAESHSSGLGRSLPSDPSGGGMWTNKFSNIRSSFESRPNSTATTPTQSRSRRSSADDNQATQVPSITAGHLQFQIKPESEKSTTPQSPVIPPKTTKPLPIQPEVKQSPQLAQKQFKPSLPEVKQQPPPKPIKPIEDPAKSKPSASKLPQPEEPEPAINMRMIPTILPQASQINGAIRSSSVGGTSALSPLVIRKRPEEMKETPIQHVRMTVQPSTQSPTKAAVAPAAATLVQCPSIRRLRNDRSCSSVRTQSSFRSDSKDDEDEEEDQEGDDEASSSTSSDDDDDEPETNKKTALPSVKVQPPTPAATTSGGSISGLKNLTKILQKFSVPDEPPSFPQSSRLVNSGMIKKSFSSHQIRSTTTPPAFLGGLSSHDLGGLSRTKSSSTFGPVPPSSLTLTGLRADAIHLPAPPPDASHYVETPGPTLVGLMARNVSTMSSAMSTAGSSNSNSIASSARNYSAANLKAAATPPDLSPTSLLMKSVSSSRIVSEAKQHLERPKSLVLNTNANSLAPPEMSPGMVRRNPSVGTKQYEASLSPDSAEKKQREIAQFFGSSNSIPAVSPLPVVAAPSPPIAARAMATASSSVTKVNHHHARSVLMSRQLSLDNNSGGSDVDELFNQLLADQILSPEAAAGHRFVANPLSLEATSDRKSSPSVGGTSRNKFADRRKAWEASTCTSMTLHSSLMMPPQATGTTFSSSDGPADMIQRSSMNNAFGSSTVQSKTEVTTTRQSNFTRSGQPGQSAFSKFQQLDQSIKSSTSNSNSATTISMTTTTAGGVISGAGSSGLLLLGVPQQEKQPSRPTTPNFLTVPASPRPRLNTAEIKERILKFCKRATVDYQNVQIENFSSSWNDGLAFCALIHHFYPDAFDYNQLEAKNKRYNFTLAFKTADEKAGIAPLLDVEDMVLMARPDWKCVFTYVQSFYRRFKDE